LAILLILLFKNLCLVFLNFANLFGGLDMLKQPLLLETGPVFCLKTVFSGWQFYYYYYYYYFILFYSHFCGKNND